MKRSATISACRNYRYTLHRRWNEGPTIAWLMLNPSTADGTKDDNTIRHCIGFSQAWGYGGLTVINLFAFRATHPRDLFRACDPVGELNDATILAAVKTTKCVVAAWGNHGANFNRHVTVMKLLKSVRVQPVCLCVTDAGHPGHPLRLKKTLLPTPYRELNCKL